MLVIIYRAAAGVGAAFELPGIGLGMLVGGVDSSDDS